MRKAEELELALLEAIRVADHSLHPGEAMQMTRAYLAALERSRPALLAAREAAAEWLTAIELEDWGSLSLAATMAAEKMDAAVAHADAVQVAEFTAALRVVADLAKPDKEAQQARHLAVED